MENLFYDLSEQEFSKGRKILLWVFTSLFLLAGMGILFMNIVLHNKSIHISFCLPPFGISIVVGIISIMATFTRKGHYFLIDNEKIEFKFGVVNPVKHSFNWANIKEVHLPHKEKKVSLLLKDNSSFIINLTWIERKKSSNIRKHFFYAAKEKNIDIVKVEVLPKK
jgi:hypothetical protein